MLDQNLFPDNVHPNAKGCKKMAKCIYNELLKHKDLLEKLSSKENDDEKQKVDTEDTK